MTMIDSVIGIGFRSLGRAGDWINIYCAVLANLLASSVELTPHSSTVLQYKHGAGSLRSGK